MFRLLLIVAGVVLTMATAGTAGVRIARVPDGGIYPQVQTDSLGRAHLIYFKGDARHGDIFYVRSDDAGRSFTTAIRVNSQPESAAIIGTVRGPHLTIGKDDRAHVAWMGSHTAEPKVHGKELPMLYARLNDAGNKFETQRNVIRQRAGLDGGGSIAADRDGNVYVAWHAPAGASDREEDRTVWIARSRDDGKTFADETLAFNTKLGACACCGMRIFTAKDGRVYMAFRSAHASVNRDVHVLTSHDHGQSFAEVLVDPWKIGVCVMSTMSFANARDDAVLGAWETQEDIRVARLDAKGQSSTPITMPGKTNKQKHPVVATNARGEYIVAWTEGLGWGKGGAVIWQAFDATGKPIADSAGRADDLPAWSVPAVFADSADGSFVVLY